jgi:hypothetical protein
MRRKPSRASRSSRCTPRTDEQLQAFGGEFFAATEGKRTLQRSFVTLGRNDPERAWILGFVSTVTSLP